MTTLQLACPICREPLRPVDDFHLHCDGDGITFPSEDGIWRMLRPGREQELSPSITAYEAIRHAEQRGSDDPAYYRYLPFHDQTGRYQSDWQSRGERFLHFLIDVLQPYEMRHGNFLNVLDVGAGNGWMSARLSARGHKVAAVDLMTNPVDGLGAHSIYGDEFVPIQAEFDYLPFDDGSFDVVIFNDAFHYSTAYETTLQESLRVLTHDGLFTILDSPIFGDEVAAERWQAERQQVLAGLTGLSPDGLPVEHTLTFDRLNALGRHLNAKWSISWPIPTWRHTLPFRLLRAPRQHPPTHYPIAFTTRR